jgi:hypothetical protein
MLYFSYYLLCFLFNKIKKEECKTGSAWKLGGGVAKTMYTHVSKCKNDKKESKKTTEEINEMKNWVFKKIKSANLLLD